MKTEHRGELRERVALPIRTSEGGTGVTRDVSSTGLFVELNGVAPSDVELDLTVDLSVVGRAMLMQCRGDVVRVEPRGDRTGMAVRLTASKLVAID